MNVGPLQGIVIHGFVLAKYNSDAAKDGLNERHDRIQGGESFASRVLPIEEDLWEL